MDQLQSDKIALCKRNYYVVHWIYFMLNVVQASPLAAWLFRVIIHIQLALDNLCVHDVLQGVWALRGNGDGWEGGAGAAAGVRAGDPAQRGDDPSGAGWAADSQVHDQRQAPLGQDLHPQLQALLPLMAGEKPG